MSINKFKLDKLIIMKYVIDGVISFTIGAIVKYKAILGALVGIVGIALTGITIGQSIESGKQQPQYIQQVIIKGNVTVGNDSKIMEVTSEN